MALVLSMREGEDFYVGDKCFVVDHVDADTKFRVRREVDGKIFKVSEEMSTEIAEDVFASAGERHQSGVARIAIDAPRSMLIVRGDKYRNPPEHMKVYR